MIDRSHCVGAYLRRAALACLILATGCGPQQQVKPTAPAAPPPTAAAEALLRNGDFPGAAAEYQRLAATADSEKSARYDVLAALAYIDAGDRAAAQTVLESTPAAVSLMSLYSLALAAADDLESGTDAAKARLRTVDPAQLTAYERNVYQRTLGRIALADHDYAQAATAFIAADAYALPPAPRATLHRDIWLALSHMDERSLAAAATSTAQQAGWYDLARMVRPNLHDSASLAASVDAWRAEHPSHPANISLVEELFELSESLSATARHIALLLPFDGEFAGAAFAVRDGFLTAWYADSGNSSRPVVSVYTANAQTINAVYDEAVANGADLIVGPLEKPAVEALINRVELPVRTLTLNTSDATRSANSLGSVGLFQFGLTPEDEARAIAENTWADGHARVVAIGPDTVWGSRVITAYTAEWTKLGGTVLSKVTYGGEASSFARAVKQALNIDLSEARAAALRSALGIPIHFEPRRRADVDAIFLAGYPISTRQLLPQFRYFRAESVPMYSTSATFSGRVDPGADQDLDGLRFGDMPWLFGESDRASLTLFKRNWPDSAPGAGRLFAFGMDAYRILPYLARMRQQPGLHVPGNTGVLHMDADGRIVRDLTMARFVGGVPQPLGQ